MRSKSALRQHDSLEIPEGYFVEPYTPQTGRIISPALQKPLQVAKLHLNEEATCNLKDSRGNAVNGIVLPAGPVPFPITEVSSTGGVTCFILHDGKIYSTSQEDLTAPVYE